MILNKIGEQFAYGLGTGTGIIAQILPGTRITLTGIKTGARLGRTIQSFGKGGWHNPVFYVNSLSTCCSGASFTLYCMSSGVCPCPTIALPLYGASQICGATADILDSTFNIGTLF